MRNWSHHYSTDTVDDPVFRAAMRGCDAVSFVFGLEVTWSLIQQRQQEEEEAQAAKVLEEMQENGQLEVNLKEDDNDKDDEADAKPAAMEADDDDDGNQESDEDEPNAFAGPNVEAKTKHCAMDLEDSDESDGDEDDDSPAVSTKPSVKEDLRDTDDSDEDDERTAAPSNHVVDNSNDSAGSDDDEEEPAVAKPGPAGTKGTDTGRSAPPKKTPILLDSSSDEDAETPVQKRIATKKTDQSDVMDSLVSATQAQESSALSGQWNCAACTFLNDSSAPKCVMCHNPRPSKRRTSL